MTDFQSDCEKNPKKHTNPPPPKEAIVPFDTFNKRRAVWHLAAFKQALVSNSRLCSQSFVLRVRKVDEESIKCCPPSKENFGVNNTFLRAFSSMRKLQCRKKGKKSSYLLITCGIEWPLASPAVFCNAWCIHQPRHASGYSYNRKRRAMNQKLQKLHHQDLYRPPQGNVLGYANPISKLLSVIITIFFPSDSLNRQISEQQISCG